MKNKEIKKYQKKGYSHRIWKHLRKQLRIIERKDLDEKELNSVSSIKATFVLNMSFDSIFI
jgi:hypothetical protein